ncbi:MAG: squalene/phytoene synthase family protein [Longimicrobiales bacterium]|nr:squalene/phytoene synthase family protein [Longimicrobiales bacterium]
MPTLNELLHAASRTFALGIDLLPPPLRDEIELAYLLLRVSDYLEDNEAMPAAEKARLLEAWAAVLAGEAPLESLAPTLEAAPGSTPDALVARNVRAVHGALAKMRPAAGAVVVRHVRDSTLGMARWARRGPELADEADLDDYMHEVAGRVGWLLTELFALDVPAVARRRVAMSDLGREFGLGLQTVNVVRGLHGDWRRGWVFIPRDFLPAGGDPTRLFTSEGRDRRAELAVLGRLVRKAEHHLEAARRYIAGIPRHERGIRLFCLLPYLFAVRTLALSRRNPRVFQEETKITRRDVRRITAWARLLGGSDRWVAWYGRRLAR